jgi:hypothetical protein
MIQSIGICRVRLKAKEGENPQVASRRGGAFRNASVSGGNNCFSVIDARINLYPVGAAMKLPPGYLSIPAKRWDARRRRAPPLPKSQRPDIADACQGLNRTGASIGKRLRTLQKAKGK